jgi:hypothetical protein
MPADKACEGSLRNVDLFELATELFRRQFFPAES